MFIPPRSGFHNRQSNWEETGVSWIMCSSWLKQKKHGFRNLHVAINIWPCSPWVCSKSEMPTNKPLHTIMVFPLFFEHCRSNHISGQTHMLFLLDRLQWDCLRPHNWRVLSSKCPTLVFAKFPSHRSPWRNVERERERDIYIYVYFFSPWAPLFFRSISPRSWMCEDHGRTMWGHGCKTPQIQGICGLQDDYLKKLDGMQTLHKRCVGSPHSPAVKLLVVEKYINVGSTIILHTHYMYICIYIYTYTA